MMNTSKIVAAVMLACGAYMLIREANMRSSEDSGDWIADTADSVSETASAFLGVDMGSSRYARALENPANAEIINLLSAAEQRNGIPAGLLVRQAWQESRFNPSAVNEISGAKGLMQFMDSTAAEWGVDQFDPASSANGAGRYMAWLYMRVGSWPLALAAYNWGIGNVLRKGIGAAPSETKNYVAQIGADVGIA